MVTPLVINYKLTISGKPMQEVTAHNCNDFINKQVIVFPEPKVAKLVHITEEQDKTTSLTISFGVVENVMHICSEIPTFIYAFDDDTEEGALTTISSSSGGEHAYMKSHGTWSLVSSSQPTLPSVNTHSLLGKVIIDGRVEDRLFICDRVGSGTYVIGTVQPKTGVITNFGVRVKSAHQRPLPVLVAAKGADMYTIDTDGPSRMVVLPASLITEGTELTIRGKVHKTVGILSHCFVRTNIGVVATDFVVCQWLAMQNGMVANDEQPD